VTARRVTPTGVPVPGGHAEPGSDEWLAARLTGITATDMSKLMDVSPWGDRLTVWTEKTRRGVAQAVTAAMELGSWFEDAIAKFWLHRVNRKGRFRAGSTAVTIRRVPTLHHIDHRHHLASLDRLVVGCPDHARCALEVKRRVGFTGARWNVDVPDDVYAQVAWQIHVSGVDAVHVVADIGSDVVEHVVTAADVADLIPDMIVIADTAWDEVVRDAQPWVDPTPQLVESLTKLFQVRDGEVDASYDPDVWRHAADYLTATATAAEAEKTAATAKAWLMQKLGSGSRLVAAGVPVCGFRPRVSVDAGTLFDNDPALFSDLAAAGFVSVSVSAPEVRDDDPELYDRVKDAGFVKTGLTWYGPKPKDIEPYLIPDPAPAGEDTTPDSEDTDNGE